jgi:hypothetical protein
MAKKQSMNLLEAHLEKVAIGSVGLVFLWVLVTRFILACGIETPDGIQPVPIAVTKAAQEAEKILIKIKPTPGFTPERVASAKNPTEEVAFQDSPYDKVPVSPVYGTELIDSQIKDKIANFPKKFPAPRSLSLGIYHTQASLDATAVASTVGSKEIQEVDFVTVEGIFPISQLRPLFQQSFQDPGLKQPVDYPEPIVAAVELQRSQLMPNGSWSDWQRISRLDIDPGSVSEIASDDFKDYSTEKYKAILNVRNSAYMQKRILQPMPYTLLSEEWFPPTERAKLKKEEAKSRRTPGDVPGVPGLPGTVGSPVRPPAPGADNRSRRPPTREGSMYYDEEMELYGREREFLSDEEVRGYGAYGGYPSRIRQMQISSEDIKEAQEYLKQDEVSFWAHDDSVVPGVVYRYQMRLGFFNPIAGTDRFLPGDIEYKNKIILWSDFLPTNANEQKFVQVDKRVHFFPRTSGPGEKEVATVDVFRQHEGRWYQRPYTVIPGSTIGGVDPPEVNRRSSRTIPPRLTPGFPATAPGIPGRRATLPNAMNPAEPEKIDFRTGVTIIDITPKTAHWYSSGSSNSLNQQTTSDLVYRDVDGFVKSIPVDNRCWPKELRQLRADILKKMREEETPSPTQPRPPERRGVSGRPVGRSVY